MLLQLKVTALGIRLKHKHPILWLWLENSSIKEGWQFRKELLKFLKIWPLIKYGLCKLQAERLLMYGKPRRKNGKEIIWPKTSNSIHLLNNFISLKIPNLNQCRWDLKLPLTLDLGPIRIKDSCLLKHKWGFLTTRNLSIYIKTRELEVAIQFSR